MSSYVQIAASRWPSAVVHGEGRFAVVHGDEVWLCTTESDAHSRAIFWDVKVHDLEPRYVPEHVKDNVGWE
jgi:hypothetical protein